MKRHSSKLLLLLLFLLSSAMSCEEEQVYDTTEVLCLLKEVNLNHWNNAGEQPEKVADKRIPKEAYLLEISLFTEKDEENTETFKESEYTYYRLSDGIEKIRIFSDVALNPEFLAGTDITSCFFNYPQTVSKYQLTDCTIHGETLELVDKTNHIYKALMTIPQPGTYHFRVVLTLKSGTTIEKVSEAVTFY